MDGKYSLSIVIPARDEEGTISKIPLLIPKVGKWLEIIFVEGYSRDNTWREIQKQAQKDKRIRAFKQGNKKGKAQAVEVGFEHAKGDIVMILDSDLSVSPGELIKFYRVLASGKADFVNGSRFVYPKEKGAMRYFNHLGNRFFALVFSLILRQKITDTLCGTKAFFRKDYENILKVTDDVRRNDPYGDFTLLLGAGKLGLKVAEVPVNYKARTYGESKISPFWDGIKLVILLSKDLKNYLKFIFS
ncbi:hypothetical protein A3E46_02155 [Candidatus Woesebacteria bacterium RIFCSPHIGHO2_12_FULL_46_16]|uniref:Glycosyltransferase 2-like domain-containing protein n=1 Tax=Candidatus Woesebacteria bacterium RIFCSPHIGHO2_12_FULL_46_16 TaxID=1802513 RepID=A0A1F8B0Y3_9BACT|nr:MAG: hypothetical protein A3E46_02155 [Candidatus Woesebacteria bacterium RIFCSPHIGHO2_12_FULL_46_16]